MALNLEGKKAIVAEVNEVAAGALSAVIADYRGLSVAQMTELRKQARDQGVYLKVVRNTLAKLAVKDTEFECLTETLVGPTILALSLEDPGAAARMIKDYAKENDKLEVKALAVGGVMYGAAEIDRLAKLPTREQALGMLAGVLQAPVTKFARTLNDVPGKIARVVAAVKDQKAA
ncbi:MAG: 50S ribosomal protein L10 [Pseudomonadota bacterium]|nr:50S ribosomal protein L10 [Pseudomonadales bacterium]MDY6921636.1 50S ribosomal protein L10 [Pseudomonadota bacterium]